MGQNETCTTKASNLTTVKTHQITHTFFMQNPNFSSISLLKIVVRFESRPQNQTIAPIPIDQKSKSKKLLT